MLLVLLASCSKIQKDEARTEKDQGTPVDFDKNSKATKVFLLDPPTLDYCDYGDGRMVQLEYDSLLSRLSFRISSSSSDQKEYTFLKNKVMEIVHKKELSTPYGYSIHYLGGYPTCSPYTSLGPGYEYLYLTFSHNAKVIGKDIYIKGSDNKSVYYPYSD